MKKSVITLFTILLLSPSIAQEKKVFLNFFTGVASFNTHITHIEGDDFQSSTLYSMAPTGLGLDFELLDNAYLGIQFGTQKLYNDYLRVAGDNYAARVNRSPISARDFGIKLKYQINLSKTFKITPFIGYSISFLNQPVNSTSPFEMRSKSSSTASVNGVVTNVKRDSIFSSTEFVTNKLNNFSVGGELLVDFKNNLGIYLSYAFSYNSAYYAVQYGEYHSTSTSTQKANTSFGKSGHYYQLGLRYHIFNH
jgi:hypothetical protein